MIDILYIKGITSPNSDLEIKYSLRSLCHVKDLGRVFISGIKPSFVTNVTHIPCYDIGYPMVNHWWKVSQAIKNSDISENFVLMYDDIFFLKDICLESYPSYYRGNLGDFETGTLTYQESLSKTKKWLLEHDMDILDYELHVPFIYNRENFLILDKIYEPQISERSPLAVRSMYGNIFGYTAIQRDDFKMRKKTDKIPDRECFSCSDEAFPFKFLDNLFPEKGDFEK